MKEILVIIDLSLLTVKLVVVWISATYWFPSKTRIKSEKLKINMTYKPSKNFFSNNIDLDLGKYKIAKLIGWWSSCYLIVDQKKVTQNSTL